MAVAEAAAVVGIAVATLVAGSITYLASKAEPPSCRDEAAAAKAWGELPTKTILKYGNFDTYMLKRQEYIHLIMDLNNKKDMAIRKEYYDHMKDTLRSIRSSPFFVPSTEFDILWYMVATTNPKYPDNPELERVPKTKETCEVLRRLFPEIKDGLCKDPNGIVTVRMAYEAFEKQMLVIPP